MADVGLLREARRQRRLFWLSVPLLTIASWMWWRVLTDQTIFPRFDLGDDVMFWLPGILIILLLAIVLVGPMLANGRSPHILIPPELIDVDFEKVRGLDKVRAEVEHTLQVLQDHEVYRNQMGGTPRRGILFEGPPGTGKTHMAKAMASEAGVPFLFVSATSFQSMWYGMTARKIRAFFRTLRQEARDSGGVIGFIEEIDAIGMARGGVSQSVSVRAGSSVSPMVNQGTGGVVNELLIQMQSFDDPLRGDKVKAWFRAKVNLFLPAHSQLRSPVPKYSNLLLIAATNRAADLDPALMRPGRFDRVFHFGLPGHTARRDLIEYFLSTKAHVEEAGSESVHREIASATLGYTPAMLERLFDEALLIALRDGRTALTREDVRKARFEIELGLPEEQDSPDHELETIATHEAGHATVAYLVGKGRKLEVLSIVKRREALGFLAHRLNEERHTQKRSEMEVMIQIAMGGMVAEEIYFGESGSGPAGDLTAATSAAVEMVGSMGLGGSLISFRALDPGAFGGNLVAQVLADNHGRRAVEDILSDQKQRTTRLLGANRHILEALRDALLERRELVDHEILDVIHAAESRRLTSSANSN